ncbi:MAG: DUF2336 domain-containing protein [Rhodospirillaceae bacterium]|jgi:hypothetical protein|nr:DUF2336 domain-containing protein [Rhodospirillaceae bacterium]MBT5667774.1 DUF2336 domain-containing protein [Rhodospirillaceae bacterium]MBT5810021.1 DUF2336 domain-containing protein [Rhodospirillaceae bacterium]
MLKWVFGGNKKPNSGPAPDYESAKEISANGNDGVRRDLAAQENLQPEFLYYFATDKAPVVRRAVAKNPGTPLQADVILSKDPDETVRCELARKVGALLPDLTDAQGERVRDIVFEILGTLAKDHVPRVRAIIASEIKLLDNVPPRIAKMLAEDVEAQVAAPILQYSPLLTKADLLEILKKGVNTETLVAVARRRDLDETVTEAIVDKDEIPAIGALLENKSALISDNAMDKIVDRAGPRKELHTPLVLRGGLSAGVIGRIASFVSASLLDPLIKHNALVDAEMATQLRESVAKRLQETDPLETGLKTQTPAEIPDFGNEKDPEFVRAQQLFDQGRLTPDVLRDALGNGDAVFLGYALSLCADIPAKSIKKVFETKNAKSAMAIAWHCELGVEFAIALQRDIWEVPEDDLSQADPEGGYPMSDGSLEWAYSLLKA